MRPLLAHSGLSWLFLDDVRKRSIAYTMPITCTKVSKTINGQLDRSVHPLRSGVCAQWDEIPR